MEKYYKLSELIDIFRIIPRLMILYYTGLLVYLVNWYTNIEKYVQYKCDETVLQLLLDHGETIIKAQEMACTVINVTGGPSTAETTFVSALISLPVFKFFVDSAKLWKDKRDNIKNDIVE